MQLSICKTNFHVHINQRPPKHFSRNAFLRTNRFLLIASDQIVQATEQPNKNDRKNCDDIERFFFLFVSIKAYEYGIHAVAIVTGSPNAFHMSHIVCCVTTVSMHEFLCERNELWPNEKWKRAEHVDVIVSFNDVYNWQSCCVPQNSRGTQTALGRALCS